MARLLGEARVSVLPDSTRFKPEAEAKLKKASEELRATATIGVKLDDKELKAKKAQIIASINELKSKSARVRITADDKDAAAKVAQINAALTRLSHRAVKAKTDVEIADSEAKIARLGAQLSKFALRREKAKAKVDIGDSIGKLDYLKLKLAEFGHKVATARARINTSSAKAGLRNLVGFIRTWFNKEADKAAADAGNGAAHGFAGSMAKSAAMQAPLLTAGIVAGFAALPAAIGAVGVLGGIALGAGLIFAAKKLISKQVKTITSQLSQLQTQMGGKPASPTTIANQQLSIRSTQATIARLSGSKKLTASQKQQLSTAQQRLPIQQQALAASQGKGQGTSSQRAQQAALQKQLDQYNKYVTAFQKLDNAVTNVKFAFLQFAVVATKPLIKPFADALNYLASQMKGPLAKEFRSFFTAIGPLVKPVVTALLEIVKGVLPGMTAMLKGARGPLSSLFVIFGKIVGVDLGRWFKTATPYIKDSSKYFLALMHGLGTAGTLLIKFGGESAKAFGNPALKGFGPMIIKIANDLIKMVKPAFDGWIGVMAPVAKALLKILVPILNFLAVHPAYVKAIAATIAAFLLFSKLNAARKAIMGVKIALEGVSKGTWIGLLITAIVLITTLIITHWSQIAAFFVKVWKHIWSGFIGPLINFFTKTIPHAFGVTINWLKKNWPLLLPLLLGPMGIAVALIIKYWRPITGFFVSIWKHIWSGFIGPLINFFTKTVPHAFGVTINWLKKNWPFLIPILLGPIGIIAALIIKYHAKIFAAFKSAWAHVKNDVLLPFIHWFTNSVPHAFGVVLNHLVGWGKDVKHWLSDAWNWVWDHVFKPVGGFLTTYVINPFKTVLSWVNEHFIKPFKSLIHNFPAAISRDWNSLRHIFAAPIKFLVGTVYDHGIAPFWNNTVQKLGGPHLNTVDVSGWATGGHVPGYAPGKDTVPAMLSPGEYVLNPRAVKAIGVDNLHAMNRVGFASGGPVGGHGGGKASNPNARNRKNINLPPLLPAIGHGLVNLGRMAIHTIRNLTGDAVAALFSKAVNPLLNSIPGTKVGFGKIALNVGKQAEAALVNWIKGNMGPQGGSGPMGGATGSEMQNGKQLFAYLLANVFPGHPIAAAGATASIWGESTWNPFAQGTGGRGLIGWTPPGTISDADFRGGMRTQLPAIIRFIGSSGDWGRIAAMKNDTSVSQAAWDWGRGIERFGIPDVHSAGISLATQIMNQYARSGAAVSNPFAKTIAGHTARKFAGGGVIHEPVAGVGLKTGLGYSFGEGGRRERVLTDAQSQAYDKANTTNALLSAILDKLEKANALNTRIADSTRNSAQRLGGTGRGVL